MSALSMRINDGRGSNSLHRSVDESSTNDTGYLDSVLRVIYDSISELNMQLPKHLRVEKSLAEVLLGTGGKLDSLTVANFIVIAEQKLKASFGFPFDLTQDDAFSSETGYFRTVQSLATYIAEMVEKHMSSKALS
ncbi:MAG: hypothetical protein DMG88_21695 [Acidobacteria bacterium]|nr:MAG: hypothetical protein DMG88_21695 [Acidobacteriota bacterium]